MSVKALENMDQYKEAIAEGTAEGKLVVIDFHAVWCGPCKVISPKVVEFSGKYENAVFYKVDVDKVPDVAADVEVRAMPTFCFFKGGEKVAEVVGANPSAIEGAIMKHI